MQMVPLWISVYLLLLVLVCVFTTLAFCYWFIYIFQAIGHKWNGYKKSLRWIKLEKNDNQHQTRADTFKTELIKNIFLFGINLAEWLTFVCAFIIFYMWNITDVLYTHCNNFLNKTDIPPNHSSYILCFITYNEMHPNSIFLRSIHYFGKNLIVLSFVLVSSLCMYLAGRYTHITWIKSTKILHIIGIFSLYLIFTQVIAIFCYLEIFAKWLNTLLFTLSIIISFKEYRKLCMVINWTIVDLSISGNKPNSLARQIKMRKTSNKMFKWVMTGALILLFGEYMQNLMVTLTLILRNINATSIEISLCESSRTPTRLIEDITHYVTIFSAIAICICAAGMMVMLIPYIVYGISGLCSTLWRLFRGKSSYKTHYSYESLYSGYNHK